jgi:hypothetical protein
MTEQENFPLADRLNTQAIGQQERHYWVDLLQKIARPVLSHMANGSFTATFPIELSPTWDGRNKNVSYMEAFACQQIPAQRVISARN